MMGRPDGPSRGISSTVVRGSPDPARRLTEGLQAVRSAAPLAETFGI